MRIVSLASGSHGNAYAVVHGCDSLLIDCGINRKTLRLRVAEASELPPEPLAVLLTHSHTDHTDGLKVLLKHHPDLSVYANAMTAEAVSHDTKIPLERFVCFENGQEFGIGNFTVNPFSIPHDTADPVAFLIRSEDGTTYFHGTDIGTPLASIGIKLSLADVATVESNHDPVMLRCSGRPPSLIQRISGPRGHLSNDQACELVERFASPRLKRLALAHLSRDCNAPNIAKETMTSALKRIGRTDIALSVLSQDDVVEF